MRQILLLWSLAVAGSLAGAQDNPIRVNVNLVQIDVTVTDKAGRHVAGLTAEDFEILEDGKKQPITNLLWVGKKAPPGPSATPATEEKRSAVAALPQLRKDQVRRTVVLYVDDLSLSIAGMKYTREAIQKFVERNLADGDLVAVFRSTTGTSFLQQFSSDRRQLLAAIERMQYRSLNGIDALAAIQNNSAEDSGDAALAEMARRQRLQDEVNTRLRQDILAAGVLSSMRYLIQGMKEMPGRKSVVLFSESMQLFDMPQNMFNPEMTREDSMRPGAMGGQRERTVAALRSLTELANRNGVVLYAIDPRGLQTLQMTALDTPSANVRRMQGQMNQRVYEFNASQDGMAALAEETGGLFFRGTNDITAALAAAVDDQEEYYLLGFNPDDASFERTKAGPKYHKLEVRLKKPGLRVRFRKSYLGLSDADRQTIEPSPLVAAMMSPFRSVEVPLRLTPIVRLGGAEHAGALRVLVHMDASRFQYNDIEADGADANRSPWKQAQLEVAIFLFDLEGQIVERMAKTHTIKVRGKSYELLHTYGLVQEIDVPIRKAGNYQVRAAVLDQGSKLAGSAMQFVQVPDLKKKRLESSDLILNGEGWEQGKSLQSSPALRQLWPGETLKYLLLVYNATRGADRKPKLETQVSLYRDGKLVHRGPKTALQLGDDKEGLSLTLSGGLKLGSNTPVGEYVLEVAVRDLLAPKKEQFLVRQLEFQLVAPPTSSGGQ